MRDRKWKKEKLKFLVTVEMEYDEESYTRKEMVEHAQWACVAYSLSGSSRNMEIKSAKLIKASEYLSKHKGAG